MTKAILALKYEIVVAILSGSIISARNVLAKLSAAITPE